MAARSFHNYLLWSTWLCSDISQKHSAFPNIQLLPETTNSSMFQLLRKLQQAATATQLAARGNIHAVSSSVRLVILPKLALFKEVAMAHYAHRAKAE